MAKIIKKNNKNKKQVGNLKREKELSIHKQAIRKAVKEISQQFNKDLRWTFEAVFALEKAAETFLTCVFENSL